MNPMLRVQIKIETDPLFIDEIMSSVDVFHGHLLHVGEREVCAILTDWGFPGFVSRVEDWPHPKITVMRKFWA